MKKLVKWLDYNRFTVIAPMLALTLWIVAIGCMATTTSPLDPGKQVNALELQTEFEVWQLQQQQIMIRFEAGRADIEKQQKAWGEFQNVLLQLASGNVANWSGLAQLLIGGGLLGFAGDNVRKRGLIAGLKKNS